MHNFKDAVDHLPPAAVLIVDGVTWEEYESLGFDERPAIRITYNQGRLEIATTSFGHDRLNMFINHIVQAMADAAGVKVESGGGTTQFHKLLQMAAEPDSCFYVGNIERILGHEDALNMEKDPPPDIVVEIDKASQSLGKFSIYAKFRVPEIWRYDVRRKRAQIFELVNETYAGISFSRFFPMLTTEVLAEFIEQSQTVGQTAALAAFREWIKKQG